MIQDNIPVLRSLTLITSANSFIPHNITYFEIPENSAWTSLGTIVPTTNDNYGKILKGGGIREIL